MACADWLNTRNLVAVAGVIVCAVPVTVERVVVVRVGQRSTQSAKKEYACCSNRRGQRKKKKGSGSRVSLNALFVNGQSKQSGAMVVGWAGDGKGILTGGEARNLPYRLQASLEMSSAICPRQPGQTPSFLAFPLASASLAVPAIKHGPEHPGHLKHPFHGLTFLARNTHWLNAQDATRHPRRDPLLRCFS